MEAGDLRLLTFDLAGQRCAVRAADVMEVQRAVATTALPGAPAFVEGLVDLRGELVPVLDIRARLGLDPAPLRASDHLIFARLAGVPGGLGTRTVAVRVEKACDLIEAPAIADPRSLVEGVAAAGVARSADGLVIIHDLRRFLSPDDEQALDDALAAP